MNVDESYQEAKATSTKHGLTTLKRAIKALGSRVLDQRTTLAKELAEECRELVNALGGETEVSPPGAVNH